MSDSHNKSSPELDALSMLITLPSFILASATIHLKNVSGPKPSSRRPIEKEGIRILQYFCAGGFSKFA